LVHAQVSAPYFNNGHVKKKKEINKENKFRRRREHEAPDG
jgi:hypothetical protein